MNTATKQRADMRAAGAIEPTCEQIQQLIDRLVDEHGEPAAHEMHGFLMGVAVDLERYGAADADGPEADEPVRSEA